MQIMSRCDIGKNPKVFNQKMMNKKYGKGFAPVKSPLENTCQITSSTSIGSVQCQRPSPRRRRESSTM
jgi:hypothetical protein